MLRNLTMASALKKVKNTFTFSINIVNYTCTFPVNTKLIAIPLTNFCQRNHVRLKKISLLFQNTQQVFRQDLTLNHVKSL